MSRAARDLAERIAENTSRDPATGCVEWSLALSSSGYGRMNVGGRTLPVHRVAYELANGPIPEGLCLDHLCRNLVCCNPEHLEAVTIRENTLRGVGPSARQARQTHCLRGHLFDAANTRVSTGRRKCRECVRIYNRAAKKRRRGRETSPEPPQAIREAKQTSSNTQKNTMGGGE